LGGDVFARPAPAINRSHFLVEGDHFVLLRQADQVQGAIADWVMEQEAHSAKELLKRKPLAGL
jgi:hypothetical protein